MEAIARHISSAGLRGVGKELSDFLTDLWSIQCIEKS